MSAKAGLPNFHRASIVDQLTAVLRMAIRRGTWAGVLPGEHELARHLGVSRPSLRLALSRLEKSGLVTRRQRHRTEINRHPRVRQPGTPPTVCALFPMSRDATGINERPLLLEVRARLASQGIDWEEIFDPALGANNPERLLTELVAGRVGVCWLVMSASAAVQHWFEHSGRPVLILGSCHAGVRLPSLDVDFKAVGWHAAGRLAQYGHQRVAVILPPQPGAGDFACWEGFNQFARKCPAGLSVTEITTNSGRSNLLSRLKRLMAGDPRPTAILTMRPEYAVRVLFHLLQLGIRIPEDLSLISRDTDAMIEASIQELTRYRSPYRRLATTAVRLSRALLDERTVPSQPHLIAPAFVLGATLARLPAAARR